MKNIDILFIFFIGHVLGDFYLQTDEIAKTKSEKWSSFYIHMGIYSATTIGLALLIGGVSLLPIAIVLSVVHFLVDLVKRYLDKKSKINKTALFFSDQTIHVILIFIVSLSMNRWLYMPNRVIYLESIEITFILRNILKILLVIKPASIAIKLLLERFRPKSNEDKGIENAGAWIGILERMILVVFLTLGEFSAAGFVLTAKSIARYDRISKDSQFAEYYLLGTLLSSLIVLVVSVLL